MDMKTHHMPGTVFRWLLRAGLCGCIFPVGTARAQQNLPESTGSVSDSQSSKTQLSETKGCSGNEGESEHGKPSNKKGSFVIAPLPISSPALGTGIIPVVGYIFPF